LNYKIIKNKIIFYGCSNTLLHQNCIIVPSVNLENFFNLTFCERINSFDSYNILSYQLLNPKISIKNDLSIVSSDGKVQRILEDGSFTNQPPGAGLKTIECLYKYNEAKKFLQKVKFTEAEKVIKEGLKIAEDYKLEGYEAVFFSLLAEIEFWKGNLKKALLILEDGFKKFSLNDFKIKEGQFWLLKDSYEKALNSWSYVMGQDYIGMGSIMQMYSKFISFFTNIEGNSLAYNYIISDSSFIKGFDSFLQGWKEIFLNNFDEAKRILKPSLKINGMEFHHTGYFLASYLSNAYSKEEYEECINENCNLSPDLQLINSLATRNFKNAKENWKFIKILAPHSIDYALLYKSILKIRELNPKYFPAEIFQYDFEWEK
jgi:tetratricopeptide (TPR) repeat protein